MSQDQKPHSPATTAEQAPRVVGKPPIAPGTPDDNESQDAQDLPLPHERDESIAQAGHEPRAVIDQARKDLQAGQVDTDLHGMPGLDAERRKDMLENVSKGNHGGPSTDDEVGTR